MQVGDVALYPDIGRSLAGTLISLMLFLTMQATASHWLAGTPQIVKGEAALVTHRVPFDRAPLGTIQ